LVCIFTKDCAGNLLPLKDTQEFSKKMPINKNKNLIVFKFSTILSISKKNYFFKREKTVVEAIIFVGSMLCIDVNKQTICQNTLTAENNETTFARTVTDWQKIPSETIYNIEEEVKFEQKNISPRH